MVDAFLTGVNWGVKHTNVLTLVTTCQGQSYPSKVAELFLFPLLYRFTDCEAAAAHTAEDSYTLQLQMSMKPPSETLDELRGA